MLHGGKELIELAPVDYFVRFLGANGEQGQNCSIGRRAMCQLRWTTTKPTSGTVLTSVQCVDAAGKRVVFGEPIK
jgi:hypothetical protein